LSGKTIKEKEDHLTYILKKQKKTLSYFEVAVKGNGLFSDFEKPSTIITKSKKDPKATQDENIKKKRSINQSKKDRRFPKGRLSQ